MLRLVAVISAFFAFALPVLAQEDVSCVQRELNALGFKAGPVDGQLGRGTRNAAEAFAIEYRLNLEPLSVATAPIWCSTLLNLPVLPGVELKAGATAPKDIFSGYKRIYRADYSVHKPWAARIVEDRVRSGDKAVRIEVRSGDCELGAVHPVFGTTRQECNVGTERTELQGQCFMPRKGVTYEMGWSVYYDESWPISRGISDTVIGQFKEQEPGHDPYQIFQLSHDDGGIWIRQYSPTLPLSSDELRALNGKFTRPGLESARTAENPNPEYAFFSDQYTYGNVSVNLLSEEEMRGHWIDWRFEVLWTNEPNGHAAIFIDDELAYEYSGPTMGVVGEICHQLGIYRAQEWKVPMVAWYDDIYVREKAPGKPPAPPPANGITCLQQGLRGLGINAGQVDGRLTRFTKSAANYFREAYDLDLPELTEESASDWCASVALLVPAAPAGGLDIVPEAVEESARSGFPDVDLRLRLALVGAPVPKTDITLNLGSYVQAARNFVRLQVIVNQPLSKEEIDALSACRIRTAPADDGKRNLILDFKKQGDLFYSEGAACVAGLQTPPLAGEVEFLLTSFRDLAVLLLSNEKTNAIHSVGLRVFLSRLALGEITIGGSAA